MTTKTNTMHRLCIEFLAKLMIQEVVEDKELFLVLDKEARLLGYRLCCEQRGIHGTVVSFQKMEGK